MRLLLPQLNSMTKTALLTMMLLLPLAAVAGTPGKVTAGKGADAAASAVPAAAAGFRDLTTGMEFVRVPGGCFRMGDFLAESGDAGDELPVHEVCLADFYLGKYEVTNAQFRQLVPDHHSGAHGGKNLDGDDQPVVDVSWHDAVDYIRRLSARSGVRYRLPTEAEWEYAARSGGREELFSGGKEVALLGWYAENSDGVTHPAGRKLSNGLGLFDMSGNVAEWTADRYDEGYYGKSPRENPTGPAKGYRRVFRGGSWRLDSGSLRTSYRDAIGPDFSCSYIGFRVVAPAP